MQMQKPPPSRSERLIELLNFIANNAEFNKMDVKKVIHFYKLLTWAQSELLPKLEAEEAGIEILSVRPAVPETSKKGKGSK